ncbi:flagellar hook-length control protein FliK, partial [Paractinoplanes deccanensis]|uniref:flagellar hook-length control protein FliK n=1 Tax=Paractinoplanes deccanensis TaxID=113561 RepID=UPI00360EE176
AGVSGPQPTAPAPPPAPAAPPAPAGQLPNPPAAQLAMRIVPLKLDADGVHRLTVHLHPADLGPVQVVAEIRNGDITVQLSGSTDAGNEALRNAMDDLRRELNDAGFRNTTLDLRQGNPQQEQARQQFAASFPGAARGERAETPLPTEPAPAIRRAVPGDSRLDIHA